VKPDPHGNIAPASDRSNARSYSSRVNGHMPFMSFGLIADSFRRKPAFISYLFAEFFLTSAENPRHDA